MKHANLKKTTSIVQELTSRDLENYIAYCYNLTGFSIIPEANYTYKRVEITQMETLNSWDADALKQGIEEKEIEVGYIYALMQDLRNKQYLEDGIYFIDMSW